MKGNVRPGGTSAAELTWRLLYSLRVPELRLKDGDETDQVIAVGQLRPLTRDQSAAAAADLFRRLASLAGDYAPAGAEVTQSRLRQDLSGTPLARSPSYRQAWEVLDGLAQRLRDRTRGRLGDATAQLSLDRGAERKALADRMTQAGSGPAALVVQGEPDVGKSALTLAAAASLADAGSPVTVLSLRDLPRSTLELEAVLGAPLTEVLAATATGQVRLLVIDGAEAALEGRGQLLAELDTAALRAGLGVVAVTRTDGAGAVQQALASAITAADQASMVEAHEITRLTAQEISQVTAAFAAVRRLGEDPRAAWLLGRPGLVDLLLQAGAAAGLPEGPLSEADVFAAVWHHLVRHGEVTEPGGPAPGTREQALLSHARRALLPEDPASPPDPAALPSLRSDGLLISAGPASAWLPGDQFASDLIRDLAVARLLITGGWPLLDQADAPRWALRAARLACQAALAAAGPASETTRISLEAVFGGLAGTHGQRWAEVPLEAQLTLGTALYVLTRAWPALLGARHAGLRTVLRLALQRYSRHEIGDPAVLEPLVTLAYCGAEDLGQHDRFCTGTGEQIRDVVLAWLRGLIVAAAGPVPLRQQVRQLILARDPAGHDEWAVEALAMMGPDLGQHGEAYLCRLAAAGGGHLAPAVEPAAAARALARNNPDLLLALAERFYILDAGVQDMAGFLGGIRAHERSGGATGRLAAWYYGPFWALLNARAADALSLINRMLDHAAATRASSWQAPPGPVRVTGLELDLPGAGARWCAGDDQTWRWYRGGSTAPFPCVSALLAVERFADQLLGTGLLTAGQVSGLLLRDCQNLAMPGLVTGLLIRHQSQAGNLLDSWLVRPEIWNLEAARAATEGFMHVQGPDPDDLAGRDRRRFSFREIAASMTVQAVLDGDQDRLAELAAIADELIRRARDLVAGSQDADEEMATVRWWAAILHPENHHPRPVGDSLVIEYQPPQEVTAGLADGQESLDRGSTAYRLQATYAMALAEGRAVPAGALLDDLAAARNLADDPPADGLARVIEPVAAVAAAAVLTHAEGRITVPGDELAWSTALLIEVATGPWRHPLDAEHSIYPMGADRSAAAALPALLLPPLDEAGPDPAAVGPALRCCATSVPDEVRIIFARATAPVWAAPCAPVTPSGPCRHRLLWDAAVDGLRDCRLGRWSAKAQRMLTDPVEEPTAEALADIPASRLLLNRLIGPLITTAMAARGPGCVAEAARALLGGLILAHRRATVHWAEEGYSWPGNQHGPAGARVLAELAAAGDTGPLTGHVRALLANTGGLASLLHDLSTEFTYNQALRPALPAAWRSLMAAAHSELERNPALLSYDHGSGAVLGGLLPSPDLRLDDRNPDATLKNARETWADPGAFADLVSRWIPVARGYPEAADGLVRLARCGSLAWQATTGLTWAEELISGCYPA
jgi:hypothetical protein